MIETRLFGNVADGRTVKLYILKNRKGEHVELSNFGAAIHSLYILDKHGTLGDVVLGAAEASDLQGRHLEGVTIGRVANRIAFGKCFVNGKPIQLECNNGAHFLHGGSGNYAMKLFSAESVESENAVIFHYYDVGEGGFDCAVDVQVKYSFNDESRLQIEYTMMPYGDTLLCPTNHAYFNLSGGDVLENELEIRAEKIAVKNAYGVPDGKTLPVEGTPYDFRRPRSLADAIAAFEDPNARYDDTFLINEPGLGYAAQLQSKRSGRCLQVYSDMPALVVFTMTPRTPIKGKYGRQYEGYCAICLESQFVPNAVNCQGFISPLFLRGQRLHSTTAYQFSVI